MKLCFVAPGHNTHTQRWLAAFVRRGHAVHLVRLPGDPPVALPGVTVHTLPQGRPKVRFMQWTWALRRILRETCPDILHGHYLTRYGWLAAASLFRPLVLTAWGSDVYIDPPRSRVTRWVTGAALRRAALITVDATDLRERTLALGAQAARTEIVQWGVDTAVFRPDTDTTALRQALGLGAGPVILSTRALTPLYNQDILIEALPRVLDAVPDARLIIKYGAYEADYLARVTAAVTERGLAEVVRFVGQTPYNELAAYYALADVFVSIASSDGTPVSLLEAIACGATPIVGELPALTEWVRDGENGFCVPSRDPLTLAHRIRDALQQPALRRAFAEKNERLIHERADHEQEMARMEAFYERLTCERS